MRPSQRNSDRIPRVSARSNDFLTTVGSGATLLGVATAAGAQSPQASSGNPEKWQPMRHSEDDWLELPGKHRFIFDTTTPDSMNERHRSTPFGYTNAIWEKYGVPISTRQNFVDPQTKEAPKVNVYARQIDGLVRRGAHFAVCQMATRAYAGVIATAVGSTQDAIYSELATNLVPNAHLVPAGIVAVNRAQERGYSFMAG
jgi:intracellular sulfur oxidation DsrE/DsrF family protein